MNEIIMKALYESFAQFIRDFFKSAARQGFSIMLLLAAVCALAYYLNVVHTDMQKAQDDCKSDIKRITSEMRAEVIDLRVKLDACNADRLDLSIKVRTLTEYMNLKLKKR